MENIESKLDKFKREIEKERLKEEITIDNFRLKFCNECYWSKNNGCDIERVTLEYCSHALVDHWKYKLI